MLEIIVYVLFKEYGIFFIYYVVRGIIYFIMYLREVNIFGK